MRKVLDTLRRIAGPTGISRCGAIVVALGALLLTATIAAAREPGGSAGPYAAAEEGFGLNSPIEAQSNASDGVSTADANFAEPDLAAVDAVIPVAAETDATTERSPLPNAESFTTSAERQELLGASDPLSRLRMSGGSEGVDPAETLQDWAEGAGLLVAFVVVSLWIVRQYVAKRANPGGPTTHLRTIESLTLPQRCRVHLVDVGGRQVLVAADAAGVKCITVLPDRFHSLLDDAAHETTAPAAAMEPDRDQIWEAIRESRIT